MNATLVIAAAQHPRHTPTSESTRTASQRRAQRTAALRRVGRRQVVEMRAIVDRVERLSGDARDLQVFAINLHGDSLHNRLVQIS